MTNNRSGLIESTVLVLAALALTLVAAELTSAQKTTPAPPASSRPNPVAPSDDRGTLERELQLSRQSKSAELEQNRKRLMAQLEMDLVRLEQLNDEQIAPLLGATSPDYEKLSQAAAEIKDCATRIKYGVPLSLKKKGERIRYEARANELGSMLPELSSVIKSFTGNPVFHQRDRNDAELRSAAGHDLEGIIKLSGTINKMAKRLAKAPTRSSR